MAQSGTDHLSGSQALGTSGTIGPTLMGSNIMVDISIELINGGTAPTTEASVTVTEYNVNGGVAITQTVLGSDQANGTSESQFIRIPATVYSYKIDWQSGDDQAVIMNVTEGRYAP